MTRGRAAARNPRAIAWHLKSMKASTNASDRRVVVYSTVTCGYCRMAEALLKGKGIPFEKVDVTHDAATRAELVERANGRRTVPVIFIDGEPIGGYTELAQLSASGELDRRLGQAA